MNIQLSGTEEFIDGKSTGSLGIFAGNRKQIVEGAGEEGISTLIFIF